jgi:hypothetical protein
MLHLRAVVPRKKTAMGGFVDFAEMKAHCSVDRERVDPILGWELSGKGSRVDHIRLKLSRSCWKL